MRLSLSGFLFEDNYKTVSLSFRDFVKLARRAWYDGMELRDTQISPASSIDLRREVLDIAKGEGLAITCLTARGLPKYMLA